MCVCERIRFSLCGNAAPPPSSLLGPERESAHDIERSGASENAESIDSQRSAWCMEEARVAAYFTIACCEKKRQDSTVWNKEMEQFAKLASNTGIYTLR